MRDFVKFGKKIIAVGRNYKSHILEMGSAQPTAPFFFLKPTTSYVEAPNPILLPKDTLVHYEVELGVVIGKMGKYIPKERAMAHIEGYCVALDLTARQQQQAAAASGLPWTVSKGYDTFCPVSHFVPKAFIPNPHDLTLWLTVNGETRQKAKTSDMLFDIPTLIAHISSVMKLEEGDLILTGTPAGVGLLQEGDALVAGLDYDMVKMHFKTLLARPPPPF